MSHPSKLTLVSIGALAGLALAATPARGDDWSSLGLTASQTRLSGERSGSGFATSTWTHALPSDLPLPSRALIGSPAVADGYVVLATQVNLVRAVRERDGQLIWQVEETGPVYGSPTIGRGLVYVMGGNQQLQAFRLADGEVAWRRQLSSFGPASPVFADDSLFVPSAFPRTRVLRLRAATGELQWDAGAGVLTQSAMGSITLAGERVLVGENQRQAAQLRGEPTVNGNGPRRATGRLAWAPRWSSVIGCTCCAGVIRRACTRLRWPPGRPCRAGRSTCPRPTPSGGPPNARAVVVVVAGRGRRPPGAVAPQRTIPGTVTATATRTPSPVRRRCWPSRSATGRRSGGHATHAWSSMPGRSCPAISRSPHRPSTGTRAGRRWWPWPRRWRRGCG